MKIEKTFEDQINIPILTTKLDEVEWNSPVRDALKGPLPKDNLWRNMHNLRAELYESLNTNKPPVIGNSFSLSFPAEPVIWHRNWEYSGMEYYEVDGAIWMKAAIHPERDQEIKNDTKVVWTDGVMTWEFNRILSGTPKEELNSEEYRIKHLTELASKQSVINIFNKYNENKNKKMYLNGNDVLIDGKKVMGQEAFKYNHLYHEHCFLTWDVDPQLIQRYLATDKNHLNSMKKRGQILKNPDGETKESAHSGLTVMSKELPNLTKEEFVEEFIKEMNYFMLMIDMISYEDYNKNKE